MSTSMTNPSDMANMQEIINLVRLLRQNGDKVLSATSKLSLSTTLLHNLNEAFSLIVDETEDLESSFQVCNSSKIDIFRDLKFLHDFVQKTVGLKVTKCSMDVDVQVDITKFRHLKYLELKKVSIASVKGIQGVRGQLESVICTGRRSVCTLDQLLAECGADAGVGFVWGSLRHLALPHNALKKLDSSLELTPWLQIIDLSHNLISNAMELQSLPSLKYVNLSYNKLDTVPIFNKAVLHSLQVLVLKNNYIEDINGLQGLECLTELDLSFNCLTEHSVLWPLEKMSALLWLCLKGNPLSYHPKHRLLSIKHLHPCLSDNKLVLDQLPLSRREKFLLAENRISGITAIQSTCKESIAPLTDSITSSIVTISDDMCDSKEIFLKSQCSELSDSTEKSSTKSKRKSNVKEAVITEDEQGKEEINNGTSNVSCSYLETSKDHLETKKQILALREKFGENYWLSSHAGSFVQDIMGLQTTVNPTVYDTSKTMTSIDTMSALDSELTNTQDNTNSKSEEEAGCSTENDYDSAVQNSEHVDQMALNDVVEPHTTDLVNVYDPDDEIGDLYIVQKRKNADEMEELFLVITAEDIKERDAVTGKMKYCWSINSVLSCVLGRGEPVTVDIIFDTTRKDRQNRRYFVEPDEAKKIVAMIGEKINKRPIMLKVFKCMKCSTHFSQDVECTTVIGISGVKQLKCPTCESTLVIQTDELSIMDTETARNQESMGSRTVKDNKLETSTKTTLPHSDSYSSIGGAEGGAISVTNSLVHFDSHPHAQVCCSATSLEESRESTPSASALTKRYESDIEILSNPSQSSIEVLDEAARTSLTPNRKRSSEERRTAIAPTLLTIPDTTPITTGLTESSSSGSLTDSICTAYENKIVKQSNSYANTDKETIVTNLTSMLGGLLQSIKIGSNKPMFLKPEEDSNFYSSNVQYSYTDFSSIDHRVKLHIILNIFEHENEELVLLLRADILMHSSKDVFPGCLVLSTSKVYILRINGHEGEDPQRWLQKEISWTMDRLRSFAPLPFKQGIVIELQQPNKMGEEYCNIMLLCILQDFQRTSNFLFYLTDLPLPASCEVEFLVPEHCSSSMHNLLTRAKNHQDKDTVRLLALFSSAVLRCHNFSIKLKCSALIITASMLVMLKDNMTWLLPCATDPPVIMKEHAMSNLIEIEHYGTMLTLNFLDEIAGVEESWSMEFTSAGATEAVINSVQPPWEELFSIPLQVTNRMHSTEQTE